MIPSRQPLQIGDIARADFRTSLSADAENSRIQKIFGFQFRYQPARIAISLSLRDSAIPRVGGEAGGKPIKGDTLFGQDEADLSVWIAMVVQHAQTGGLTRREFQDLVSAHWARGVAVLGRLCGTKQVAIETMVGNLL